MDASSVKGGRKKQIVLDSVVQEIDIPTGLVLFQWDALDHIPLSDSYNTVPQSSGSPFDAYHLNSIALDHDGNLIISSRETWGAYKVNHQTGAIMWTLGGKHSSFKLAPGTYWAFQHDVEVALHQRQPCSRSSTTRAARPTSAASRGRSACRWTGST